MAEISRTNKNPTKDEPILKIPSTKKSKVINFFKKVFWWSSKDNESATQNNVNTYFSRQVNYTENDQERNSQFQRLIDVWNNEEDHKAIRQGNESDDQENKSNDDLSNDINVSLINKTNLEIWDEPNGIIQDNLSDNQGYFISQVLSSNTMVSNQAVLGRLVTNMRQSKFNSVRWQKEEYFEDEDYTCLLPSDNLMPPASTNIARNFWVLIRLSRITEIQFLLGFQELIVTRLQK